MNIELLSVKYAMLMFVSHGMPASYVSTQACMKLNRKKTVWYNKTFCCCKCVISCRPSCCCVTGPPGNKGISCSFQNDVCGYVPGKQWGFKYKCALHSFRRLYARNKCFVLPVGQLTAICRSGENIGATSDCTSEVAPIWLLRRRHSGSHTIQHMIFHSFW